MTSKFLRQLTGNAGIDRTLQGLVDRFEAAFPGRIRGYYLEGSHADQTALITSDIDLIILFKDAFIDQAEHRQAERLVTDYQVACRLELDISFWDEKQLADGVAPSLKLGSILLFFLRSHQFFPFLNDI